MSIHLKEGVYSKQYCLVKLVTFGNGTVNAKKAVIEVFCHWEQDIQGKRH